jgi:phosphosulfolactate synthase (CoM biosynthesis protein A)
VDDLFKAGVVPGGIFFIALVVQMAVDEFIESQVDFGAAYIACKNHGFPHEMVRRP